MRAPRYWQRDGWLPLALQPLSCVYDAVGRWRRALARPHRVAVPVICVGNLTAGGTGKTPVVQAVLLALHRRGVRAHALTRGYGGRLAGPVQVDPTRHLAVDVGDEPLLLAQWAPTWVSRHRPAGADAAVAAGAEVIVMDDGFQNPTLFKDLSLIVVDGGAGFGNGRVHPAGPLRERPADAWRRIDGVIITGPIAHRSALAIPPEMPWIEARMVPDLEAQALRGRDVVAFAGIGRPEKFFDTVRELGAHLVATQAFPDHHTYREDEIMVVVERAAASAAIAVTTAKDAVRLPPAARAMVTVVRASLEFSDSGAIDRWIDQLSFHVTGEGTPSR